MTRSDLSFPLRLRGLVILSPPGRDPDRVGSPRPWLVPLPGGAAEPPVPAADEDPHPGESDHRVLCRDARPGGTIRGILQVGGGACLSLGQSKRKCRNISYELTKASQSHDSLSLFLFPLFCSSS